VAGGIAFGNAIWGSFYGCEVVGNPLADTSGCLPWFRGEKDLSRLEKLDPFDTGLAPRIRECYEHLHQREEELGVQYLHGPVEFPLRSLTLDVSTKDPVTIAAEIAGFDNVCYWMYQEPKLARRLFEIITDKEITRMRRLFEYLGCAPRTVKIADDYSPYFPTALFEDLILPFEMQVKEAFGGVLNFHSCISCARLLPYQMNDLNVRLFYGQKPHEDLGHLVEDYVPFARVMGGKVQLIPDLDGSILMCSDAAAIREAAENFCDVFEGIPGVTLGATVAAALNPADLGKYSEIKAAVLRRRTIQEGA